MAMGSWRDQRSTWWRWVAVVAVAIVAILLVTELFRVPSGTPFVGAGSAPETVARHDNATYGQVDGGIVGKVDREVEGKIGGGAGDEAGGAEALAGKSPLPGAERATAPSTTSEMEWASLLAALVAAVGAGVSLFVVVRQQEWLGRRFEGLSGKLSQVDLDIRSEVRDLRKEVAALREEVRAHPARGGSAAPQLPQHSKHPQPARTPPAAQAPPPNGSVVVWDDGTTGYLESGRADVTDYGAGYRSGGAGYGASNVARGGGGYAAPAPPPPERRFQAELTEEGEFVLYREEVSRPMGEIRWTPGQEYAEGYINSSFVFGINSRRLGIAFEVADTPSGRYETTRPAKVVWTEGARSGVVEKKGQLRFTGP